MGYFANGTEWSLYDDQYCSNCAHNHPECGCPAMNMHFLWGYGEVKRKNSLLHKIIPMEKGKNLKCLFYDKNYPIDVELEESMKSIRTLIGLD